VWFLSMLPGLVVALVIARWHYDLDLSISPLLPIAIVLVGLTATGVGYAIASFVPPMITLLLTNLLLFAALMFSPVNFPAERLPGWLQAVHQVLPITAMADVMRGTLARNHFELTAGPFGVLALWCAIGFTASYVAMNRRG
jgi:ABC-2 type transport system permease protein